MHNTSTELLPNSGLTTSSKLVGTPHPRKHYMTRFLELITDAVLIVIVGAAMFLMGKPE